MLLLQAGPESALWRGADLTRPPALANAWGMAEDSKTEPGDLSQLSFEDALRALESIVRRLESGDVPLDESISLYAQGEELRIVALLPVGWSPYRYIVRQSRA